MLNTVNIGSIHDKDGNKVHIKCEKESADDFDDEINNLRQNLATFYVRKFLLPNSFLLGTNPSVNNKRSLNSNNGIGGRHLYTRKFLPQMVLH